MLPRNIYQVLVARINAACDDSKQQCGASVDSSNQMSKKQRKDGTKTYRSNTLNIYLVGALIALEACAK